MENCKSIFLINDDIYFVPQKRILFSSTMKPGVRYKYLKMRKTVARLLYYLCEHASEHFITKDTILYEVWDKNYLSSSDSALTKSINRINLIFEDFGLPEEIVIKEKKVGFKILKVRRMSSCLFCEFYSRKKQCVNN